MVKLDGSVQALSRRSWNLTAAIAGLILAGYISFLLVENYHSYAELRKASIEQLKQDAEKRATSLSYFYSERKNDMRDLASSHAISTFFQNRALGMSMEYGLRANLVDMEQSFSRLVTDKSLEGDGIYTRIALIEKDGRTLVDGPAPQLGAAEDERGLDKYLNPQQAEASITVEPGDRSRPPQVIVSIPYYFKGEYAGEIVSWVSTETVYRHLVRLTHGPTSLERSVHIVAAESKFHLPADEQTEIAFSSLPTLCGLKSGEVHPAQVTGKDGARKEILATCVPVRDTPFTLVSVSPAADVFKQASLWQIPFAMAALALLVLGGMVVAWKINTRNLVLHTRLHEEAKSKREVEEKNRQLLKEINDRKRAEVALRESEERYRSFFEEDLSGAFILSPEGRVLVCNPAFAAIFGFPTVEEAMEASTVQFYPDEAKRQAFLDLLRREKHIRNHEAEYRRADGRIIQTIENVIGTFDEEGRLVEMKGFIIDNTDHNRLEQQLRQAQKMEAIGTLAGGIAHDFNNILTAIMGYTEMALYNVSEEGRLKRSLEQVLKAGNRAKDLVKQILTFSRQSEHERIPLQIGLVVKEALKLLRASLPTTIEIRQEISAPNAMVLADAIQVHQVLMNLCANAAYSMREKGGVLEVSLWEVDLEKHSESRPLDIKPGEYVRLTVKDTGTGMDRETRERMFDPFFTTKALGEGTGMGLAVVHGIVRSHGGGIVVESEPGEGSTFHVYIPRIRNESTAIESKIIAPPKVKSQGRILLVDDEESLLRIGQEMLEHLGYEVVVAGGSIEALQAFRRQPDHFDLVVSDQTMPRMTGAELATELMKIRPDIPIILCTGFSEMINQDKARELGVKELIMKPFVFTELAEIASRVLRACGNTPE